MLACHPRLVQSHQLEQLSDLVLEWRSAQPAMGVLVLLPEAERGKIPAIQAAFRQARLPMVGAVFPALVTDRGFAETGAWLLCFDAMPPTFLLADLNDGTQAAADRIAAQLPPEPTSRGTDEGSPLLFLIFDSLLPNIASILADLWAGVRRRVRYGGINAGSESFQPMPCLFDETRIVANGVLGLLLPAQTTALVRHGYPVAATLMQATSTEGNRIDQIDRRPAMDVYREVIKAEYGVEVTQENFYDYAVHYPFGVVALLDVLVRIPVGFNEDGAIFCVGEIPPNSVLRLIRAPEIESCDCIPYLAQQARQDHPHKPGKPLLAFYCAGRRLHLGTHAPAEIALLKIQAGMAALAGAVTLGEIDTHHDLGIPRFHNAAVVCLV